MLILLIVLGPFLWWCAELLVQPKNPRIIKSWVLRSYWNATMEEERHISFCIVKAAWPIRVWHL